MDNQKAIEHIKTIQIYSYQDGYTDEAREALDMAISALQAQEAKAQLSAEGTTNLQPTCNNLEADTIRRQAAIDLCDWYDNPSMHDDLEKLQSAQPEIVRCKDCKHHHYKKDIPYCDRIDYGYGWEDNDYCSQAERRIDD